MRIILHTEAYELLRAHVPPDTPAYAALVAATKFKGKSFVFDQYWIDAVMWKGICTWRPLNNFSRSVLKKSRAQSWRPEGGAE